MTTPAARFSAARLLFTGDILEGWQSGRMRRSRKPFRAVPSDEGSNPSPSASPSRIPLLMRDYGYLGTSLAPR